MTKQVAFTGDGTMGIVVGYQNGLSFVAIYDSGKPHDLDHTEHVKFKSMAELIDCSEVILNFTCTKSIENLIDQLNCAKQMLEDIDAALRDNSTIELS